MVCPTKTPPAIFQVRPVLVKNKTPGLDRHGGIGERGFHSLACARPLARVEGSADAVGTEQGSGIIAHPAGEVKRRMPVPTLRAHEAGASLEEGVECRLVVVRTARAEASDGGVNQPGIELREGL